MPNWCSTTYKCVGEPKEVRSLYDAITKNAGRKTSRVKNGFGILWLGNIIDQLGGDWQKYGCRGEITDYSISSDASMVTINQETAWCEQEGFRNFIEKTFPSIKVYFCEEEPGCEVFCTNSFDHFPDRYFLDSYDGGEYFTSLKDAAAYVSGIVGHRVKPDEDAINQALASHTELCQEKDEDVFFSFHAYQLVED